MKLFLKNLIQRLGYRVQGIKYVPRQLLSVENVREIELADLIARLMLEKGESLGLLQVGAYDGVSKDPFRNHLVRYPWDAILIEPQPEAVRSLKELYGDKDCIAVIQAAVTETSGETELHTIRSGDLSDWVGGMASLSKEHLLSQTHIIPDIESRICSITVPTVSFADVLDQHPEFCVDILQIDAEGADGELLELFPFDRCKPWIVHWEIKNLTREQTEDTFQLLIDQGYQIALSGTEDAMAVRNA